MGLILHLSITLTTIVFIIPFEDVVGNECQGAESTQTLTTFAGRTFRNTDRCKFKLNIKPLTHSSPNQITYVAFNGPNCLSRRSFFYESGFRSEFVSEPGSISAVYMNHGNGDATFEEKSVIVPRSTKSTEPELYDRSTYMLYDNCGETLSADSGEIHLEKYLYDGRSSAFCVWRIATGSGGTISLTEIKFDSDQNRDLYVIDGDHCGGEILLHKSPDTNTEKTSVTSKKNDIIVIFWGAGNVKKTSFTANFKTTGGVVPVDQPIFYAYPEEIMKTIGLALPGDLTAGARKKISDAIGDTPRQDLLTNTEAQKKLFTAITENVQAGAPAIVANLKLKFVELAKKLPPSTGGVAIERISKSLNIMVVLLHACLSLF